MDQQGGFAQVASELGCDKGGFNEERSGVGLQEKKGHLLKALITKDYAILILTMDTLLSF